MSSLDAKPKFRMPVSDYASRLKAARAVLDTMANAALRARATAATYGAVPRRDCAAVSCNQGQ